MTVRLRASADPVHRLALYWAPPPGSPLAVLGAAWLGRDAAGGAFVDRPVLAGFDADRLTQLTAAPRHYGLHATLKPPFALADGTDVGRLGTALDAAARLIAPVPVPGFRLALLEGFLALVPGAPCPALDDLAARCVTDFDCFRRPASAAELARRRAAGLSGPEEALLARWGYPYVLDRFRFHVSLTGPLNPAEAERLMPALARYFAPAIGVPLEIADVALFAQPAPDAPFTVCARFPLNGSKVGTSPPR